MRKNWLIATLALALVLGCRSASAQEAVEGPQDDLPPLATQHSALTTEGEPVFTVVPRSLRGDPDAGPVAKACQVTIASGIYLFQPAFQSDPAVILSSPGVPATRQLDFNRHMVAAPAVWLGLVTERGWGVRTRWYTLDQDTSLITASPPGVLLSPASPLPAVQTPVFGRALASSELHIDSWDLEVTCNLERAHWCLVLGGGLRYVHLNQNYSAAVIDLAGNQTLATAHHNLNGVGPTFSLDGRRPFACCPWLAAYGMLHGSILFGSAEDNFTGTAPGAAAQAISRHAVSVLPIGELEVGLEASRCVHHCRLFFQTGFVGQVWWGGGSPSNFDAVNNAAANNSNFGLLGIALRAGVTF